MDQNHNRRDFLRKSLGLFAGLSVAGSTRKSLGQSAKTPPLFHISLSQWSLHRSFLGQIDLSQIDEREAFARKLKNNYQDVLRGELDPLDFALIARRDFDIDAVEYVNTFFYGRAKDRTYLKEMKTRSDGEGVRNLLIMCGYEGRLGEPDERARTTAVENHSRWVEAAQFLGCHSIVVDARSRGEYSEQQRLVADGLRRLAEFGEDHKINILVENHGGISSNGQWLVGVMEQVDHPRVGTLPDFGNFRISDSERYDNYKGVEELMPYAKAVSAKSYDFDQKGEESTLDYRRLVKLVLDAGYRGHIAVEYEGNRLSEAEGIRATKALLEKIRDELTPSYE